MSYTKKWILPGQPFDGARQVRTAVFINEQHFSHEDEWDELDKISHHLELWDDNCPVACGRLYLRNDGWRIGRIAVMPDGRKKGLGALVVTALENKALSLGGELVTVAAQQTAVGFYQKLCYTQIPGTEFMDGDTPHIIMYKHLKTKD